MTDAPERIWLQSDGGFYDKDKAVGSVTWCLYGINDTDTEYTRADLVSPAPMRCAECDCEKGGADCNWIATPAPAVKVKALVWHKQSYKSPDQIGHHASRYSIYESPTSGKCVVSSGSPVFFGPEYTDTLEAAKAAAQAHHEATILAALEPATPLDDPRVKALVEALHGLQQFFAMPYENSIGRFDRLAEQYRRETGNWAPGKSIPEAYNDSTDCETRRKEYDDWVQSKVDQARAALSALENRK